MVPSRRVQALVLHFVCGISAGVVLLALEESAGVNVAPQASARFARGEGLRYLLLVLPAIWPYIASYAYARNRMSIGASRFTAYAIVVVAGTVAGCLLLATRSDVASHVGLVAFVTLMQWGLFSVAATALGRASSSVGVPNNPIERTRVR